MKTTRTLKATGLVLIAVVLGLLTVQGSYALWNKVATSNAGTIQAADFNVTLAKNLTDKPISMTTDQGTAATLQLTTKPLGVVKPGDSAYAGVQVGNMTNASADFKIQVLLGAPTITNNNSQWPLAQYLSIKAVEAPSLAECGSALFSPSTPASPAPLEIAKGANGVFCFQVSLAATMPATFNGQAASISVPITVNQF
ncbi:hypothetical protein [Arthrobacter sp. HY1533]|uniref:hypothetical protein n=1 Tax=Arthrobacter sp. HY1533 TaxID=2970919 RepID=UPI0022B9E5A4|nr:hypothetical protein [Arthrobacter sp. HY1533]